MEFEWEPEKAEENERKHGVSFEEAADAFLDGHALIRDDPDHSTDEERSILIGNTGSRRLVVVSYTLREERVRLISARAAEPNEQRQFGNVGR